MSSKDAFMISLLDKPNLRKLRTADKEAYGEIIKTALEIAENAADSSRKIPWYGLPFHISEGLTYRDLMTAIVEAAFDVADLNKETFDIMGADLHPLSLLKKQARRGDRYSDWRTHFGMPEDAEVSKETIKSVLRTLLYYAKYINVEQFGKALMSNQLEAHKALPDQNMLKLPFYPALKYQEGRVGDLNVGKFWPHLGAFYGGLMKKVPDTCPACGHGKMAVTPDSIHVCEKCNIGIKEDEEAV